VGLKRLLAYTCRETLEVLRDSIRLAFRARDGVQGKGAAYLSIQCDFTAAETRVMSPCAAS
jgi:hypothetical protein